MLPLISHFLRVEAEIRGYSARVRRIRERCDQLTPARLLGWMSS